ncbi:MAG: helix-turn-helix transcriptional regulator [Phaeodactylibacter sp.]|nr:helix-turn-helix transcriptional regulator [Phaeodactylibacter sp.]MCB9299930.1 helix-turn-helix transcriptional regulator [Lewinellaceae bacterium]
MQTLETIGQLVRRLRKEQGLPLRKIAAKLDLDPSTLSKIERGDRFPSKELVNRMAQAFDIDERELLILYHSEKIANDLYREDYCVEVLEVAEQRIDYIRQKNIVQKKLF